MAIIGYIRVSTESQIIKNQKLSILEYANKNDLTVNKWIEVKASTRKTQDKRRIYEIESMQKNDMLIVSELSRLGRSVGQIVQIVDKLVKKGIKIISLKENLELNGKNTIQDKITMTMFSLFAEIERDLISERTKEGLARARAEGKLIGRPKGPGKSKLDGKETEIKSFLEKKVSKASIAKIYGVSWPCLDNFIKNRNII